MKTRLKIIINLELLGSWSVFVILKRTWRRAWWSSFASYFQRDRMGLSLGRKEGIGTRVDLQQRNAWQPNDLPSHWSRICRIRHIPHWKCHLGYESRLVWSKRWVIDMSNIWDESLPCWALRVRCIFPSVSLSFHRQPFLRLHRFLQSLACQSLPLHPWLRILRLQLHVPFQRGAWLGSQWIESASWQFLKVVLWLVDKSETRITFDFLFFEVFGLILLQEEFDFGSSSDGWSVVISDGERSTSRWFPNVLVVIIVLNSNVYLLLHNFTFIIYTIIMVITKNLPWRWRELCRQRGRQSRNQHRIDQS